MRYKEQIAQEILKVSENDLQDPSLAVVGPAVDASKYYIEEEKISKMFAKLIASSMDKTKNRVAHSSYVEIIKQMNSLDAQNLQAISNLSESPIVKIFLYYHNGSYFEHSTNLFLENENEDDQELISPSLDNLARLGLIKLDYSVFKSNDSLYSKFTDTEEYQYANLMFTDSKYFSDIKMQLEILEEDAVSLSQKFASKMKANSIDLSDTVVLLNNLKNNTDKRNVFSNIELVKGVAIMTPFGKNFCKICLSQ